MCYYCGCEAEPVIKALMTDHAGIAARVRRLNEALAEGRAEGVTAMVDELLDTFVHHSRVEESGLFAQLLAAGEAVEEVGRLTHDHQVFVQGLSDPAIAGDPRRLSALLGELSRHAAVEDNDLFPYALQMLPNTSWGVVEAVHQDLLAS